MPKPKLRLLVESDAKTRAGGPDRFGELCAEWCLKPHRKAMGFASYDVEEIEGALQKGNRADES
jgi:hypothetical protein